MSYDSLFNVQYLQRVKYLHKKGRPLIISAFFILYLASLQRETGSRILRGRKGQSDPTLLFSGPFILFYLLITRNRESGNKEHTHRVLLCSLCFSFRCGSNVLTSRVLDLLFSNISHHVFCFQN